VHLDGIAPKFVRVVAVPGGRPVDSEARLVRSAKAIADRDPPGQPTTGTAVDDLDAVAKLAALAQQTRLAIFRLLVQQGPEGLAVGEIAERLQLAGATLSFHLKELAHAQLVAARQAGRFIYYSANYRTMNGLIDYLTRNCCQGATCEITCAPAAQRKRRNP
jgi:ArsR family transcriptional regulator